MNFKIGNDIIEVQRIERIIKKFPSKFKTRVFTDNEIDYCEKKGINKYQSYAARFAAKEAIFKAISDSLPNKYSIDWKDIEIINDISGRPHVTVNNVNVSSIDVSLSHSKDYAIATALVVIK